MYKKLLFLIVSVVFCFSIPLYAKAEERKELPAIIRWENGNGFDGSGNMIVDTWAVDTVNESGKYVLFGTEGEVLKKSDVWDNRNQINENFTETNQNTGTLAIRGEKFEGFSGIVEGTLTEKNGTVYNFLLNADNQYSDNLSIPSGEYTLSVLAFDDELCYRAIYDQPSIMMSEKETQVLKVEIIEESVGSVDKLKAEFEREEKGLTKENLKNKGTSQKELAFIGKLAAFVMIICISGYWIYRKKKKKQYT